DRNVTGVQTCALPISRSRSLARTKIWPIADRPNGCVVEVMIPKLQGASRKAQAHDRRRPLGASREEMIALARIGCCGYCSALSRDRKSTRLNSSHVST